MARPEPRELEVIRSTYLTKHMLRVTLGGDGMAQFPADQESAYIKLMFPQGEGERTLIRTYTVRHQRESEIDVDFVIHDHTGPASAWAVDAKPGDRVLVGGPGPKKLVRQPADWYLLVGDMTALPAVSVNLSLLPESASGHAVIEIASEADIQKLDCPDNVELHWVINPRPDPEGAVLLEKVRGLTWHSGQPAVWAACEFNSMRAMRRYFKEDRAMPRSHLYISSYWKIGQSEDQHKVAKKKDAEQEAA